MSEHHQKQAFDPVDPKQPFPALERGILKYWQEEDVFKRSIKNREGGVDFRFFDGPPFATGLPHYGHLLAGTIKDVIPRYQTMKGRIVQRRFGWDCHGLPVEYEIEKEYGIESKRDIEKMGTEAFNNLCRGAVVRYAKEWRETVLRMGRWVDMDHDYRTMDPDYMESIWWVFKNLYDQGLIYEGYKPMHICPRCVTPLSNFEVTQGYKDITDQSAVVKFELSDVAGLSFNRALKTSNEQRADKSQTFVLAWTTTPWTLPGNLFLAMGPEIIYSRVKYEKAYFIVAKERVADIFKDKEHEVTDEWKGAGELKNAKYKPLFPYFAEQYKDAGFRIVEADFVTTEDGTGIVHIAPGFGEDDFKIGEREKTPMLQHVSMEGRFISDVVDFKGQEVKPKDDPVKTDRKIIEFLKQRGSVFSVSSYTHSYPHCWRCDSPLINYATSSWFVRVEKIKSDMLKANAETEWIPAHIRDGRFGKWLEGARDWAISRDRFWGTPLPIWKHQETGEITVLGSRDELMSKDPKRFTKITLVRHAQSQGNVDQIYQGEVPGTDLTATGIKQAEATAKLIGENVDGAPGISMIYASPLSRTRQTAEAVARITHAKLMVDERLKEVNFGQYEGKHVNFDDLAFVRERRAHKIGNNQVESIFHFHGMETWDQVEMRCREFLADILDSHRGEHIAIVTHADLVMNFTHIFTGQDKHKVVHQPYPGLAQTRTFYWDHERAAQMDLHKEVVDSIMWEEKGTTSVELALVRHGETDYNKQNKVQGSNIDLPLNPTGRKQAEALAAKLSEEKFDLIICSDLKRAKETADILSKSLGVPIVAELALLRERDLGDWTGFTLQEIAERYPSDIGATNPSFHRATPPNGELFGTFLERLRTVADLILKNYSGKKVLLVAHKGVVQGLNMVIKTLAYEDAVKLQPENCQALNITLRPKMKRIPDVLDCWFESGAMPYAQAHYPFEVQNGNRAAASADAKRGGSAFSAARVPDGFPADFIAEGLDQTRGWFYTLTVLAAALFKRSAFKHVVVNGIVLAEDGKKMSKRLKNYPEPREVVEQHGADAVRFALMSSPAVRGEDLRFSDKLVEEQVRGVLLPLWNSYNFFVTYANAANFRAPSSFTIADWKPTGDQLDQWIIIKTQNLINTITNELDHYDLSATCEQLKDNIDSLTNWYIRLNRKRFASGADRDAAFDTLYRVLVTVSQLLAPFCPFITESMYLNLVDTAHGSIHMTDWPATRKLTKKELHALADMEATRSIVSQGLALRSAAKVKVRQPLASVTYALPPQAKANVIEDIIKDELNVKNVIEEDDVTHIADRIVQVNARAAGPRLGGKVQEIIKAAKAGNFEEKDGNIMVLGETLTPDEAGISYQGHAGKQVSCERGIVVTIDTDVTKELQIEGLARDLIRSVQSLRKDEGLEFTDAIYLHVEGLDKVLDSHSDLIERETRSKIRENDGASKTIEIDAKPVIISFEKI